ncbi:diacylglycerol kinase [Lentibacter algarum]|uniref:diacylglycerol kinase n=1 Tax=Lentibacter algarum TaxID=576131 RepID=UPI001C097D9F|nr:diacylglycerol kinase [Lentibacter algarum]MBU2982409.1 diacylglycerol kinase [Lentibacter algarum]
MANTKPDKVHGFAHVLAATRYSLAGARRLWGETAFRHEATLGGLALLLMALVGASLSQLAVGLVLVLVTFAIEALNTALEEIVDHISPDYSDMAKHAKDLGSFAVMCMLFANAAYLACVLIVCFNS